MNTSLKGELEKLAFIEAYLEAGPHTNRLIERLLKRGVKKIVITAKDQYEQGQNQQEQSQQIQSQQGQQGQEQYLNNNGVVMYNVPPVADLTRYRQVSV